MRRGMAIVLTLICLFSSAVGVNAENKVELTIIGDEAILVDNETGEVLYEKNKDQKMFPASITKILTVITAMDMIKNINDKIKITEKDLETVYETGASAANFQVDEEVTYKDVLLGALIPSGADATRALGNHLCKNSQEKFVAKMNALAKKLGCKNTHFVNTTGIHDPNHYTTVSDMAVITRYALKNKNFKELFKIKVYTSSNKLHTWTKKTLRNATKNNLDTSFIVGCKSGYTNDAQHTLASLISKNNHEFITIIGHAKDDVTPSSSVVDTTTLANYANDNFSEYTVIKKGALLKDIDVDLGTESSIKVKAKNDVVILLPKNYDKKKLKISYTEKELTAPVNSKDKVGTVTVKYDGTTKYKETLFADKNVSKDTMQSILRFISNLIFPYGLAILLVVVFIGVIKVAPRKTRR